MDKQYREQQAKVAEKLAAKAVKGGFPNLADGYRQWAEKYKAGPVDRLETIQRFGHDISNRVVRT